MTCEKEGGFEVHDLHMIDKGSDMKGDGKRNDG